MLVLIVSECSNKAWKRSRKVLDAFLERVAERTWRGRMTQAGLEKLRQELSEGASKQTSVAAWIVRGRDRFELEWIVGTSAPFGPDGQYATYSGSAYDKYFEKRPEHPASYQALAAVLELSGLWHDFGKANEHFQSKLRDGLAKADPVRHEILSNIVFTRAMSTILGSGADTEEAVRKAIKEACSDMPIFTQPKQRIDITPAGLPYAFRLAAWLIATHHRLPTAEMTLQSIADSGLFTAEEHVDERELNTRMVIDERVITDRLAAETLRLVRKIMSGPELPEEWVSAPAMARLSLILADREVSKRSFDPQFHSMTRPSNGELLANFGEDDGIYDVDGSRDKARRPKQTLEEHLLKVAEMAPTSFNDAIDLKEASVSLPSAGLPKSLRGRSPERFSWQNDAVDVTKAERRHDAGFFGEVMAGTGSGKTRGCPKILAAAGDELRYSLCLPLRSLTLQAGTDYRVDLGLDESDVATVIGSAAIRELYVKRDPTGSENGEDDIQMNVKGDARRKTASKKNVYDGFAGEEEEVESEKSKLKIRLPSGMWKHVRNRKEDEREIDYDSARLLSYPILVCTIDQLMKAADGRRTSYIMAALRLMSSDLILDEIDGYDAVDQVAIGRLVFLAGAFGRKVIISSASVLAPHAEGLFRAYREGYAGYAKLHGLPFKIDVGLYADSGDRATLCRGEDMDSYRSTSAAFRRSLADALAQRQPVRIGKILPRIPMLDLDGYHELARAGISQLHRDRCTTDKRTGKNVSAILVRFAHVNSCVRFAHWLSRKGLEGKDLKIVVYHSRFPLKMRNDVEVFLDQAFKRKGKKDNFTEHPLVRSWLSESKREDNVLVIVATSVEEIGRDHDFDGSVMEPTSVHSIIQCSGRIDRHRMRPTDVPNVLILPTSIRGITGSKAGRSYSRPGPEMPSDIGYYGLKSVWLDDVAPDFEVIDARPRLLEEGDSELSSLERRIISDHMLGRQAYTLAGYTDYSVKAWLAGSHAKEMRFRASQGSIDIWIEPRMSGGEFNFKRYDRKIQEVMEADQLVKTRDDVTLGNCRFLDLDTETVRDKWLRDEAETSPTFSDLERWASRFLQISVPVYDGNMPEGLAYSPDFGVFREDVLEDE